MVKVALPLLCTGYQDGHFLTKTAATAPTCLATGNKEYYTCRICNNIYADARGDVRTTTAELQIPALGHEAGDAATCEAAQTCTRCDYVFTEALGHAWTNACDTKCNNACGTTREITHNYEWIVDTEPTFDAEGVKHEECTACHDKRNENTPIEKFTCLHDFTKTEAIAATCFEAGNKEYYTCAICDKVYLNAEGSLETTVEDCIIPALGHTWAAATCSAPKTCSGCGMTEGEPLAHTWKAATCASPKTCSGCGATEGEPLAHTWKAATCIAPKTCSVCSATEGEIGTHKISKTGICTVCGEDLNRKITFKGGKLASGTYDGDNAEIGTVSGVVGDTISFPTPPRMSNYTLSGWYLDYNCTIPFEETTFNENLTIYAKWVSNVAQQITVMSFNIKTGNSNKSLVIDTILESNPYIFGVQEADTDWMSNLNSNLSHLYASVGEKRGGGIFSSPTEHNAIFYRKDMFTLIDSGTKWLSNTPDTAGSKYSYTENGKTYTAGYARIMTYVVLERKSDGARFIYVNTHLDNNGNNSHEVAEKIRQAEVDIMMNIIKSITASRGNIPVIISGDFNVIPQNRTAYNAMTQTYGYSDSSLVTLKGEVKSTMNNGTDDTSDDSIIDYIFVSHHMANAVESYTVLPSKRDGKFVSDHNAIIATIVVPKV